MKKTLLFLTISLLFSCKVGVVNRTLNFPKTEEKTKQIPNKNDLWVFILAGQSNMAGRAFVTPNDTIIDSRILSINKNGELIYAKEPLHFYEPNKTGLDCGLSFGKNLIKKVPANVSILLIPTAIGGSSISQWIGDSLHRNVKLFTNFAQKIELAKHYGIIKGILWHQGETDADKNESQLYTKRLSILFKNFRTIIENDSLPILLGELGSYSKNPMQWDKINNCIRDYSLIDENSVIVKTADLKQLGDFEHFNSKSVRILGKRFARAYNIKMSKSSKPNNL
jgi:hypothetical protein